MPDYNQGISCAPRDFGVFTDKLNELVDHYILCGFGRFSRSVAEDLDHKNHPFCIVESDASREPTLRELHYLYLLEDATSDEALLNAGVKKAAAVLALLPSDAENLYITVTAKALNPSVRIIARTLDERGELKLRRAGATEVFSPYRLASHRIVQAAMAPTVLQFMDHIADRVTLEMNLGEARGWPGSCSVSAHVFRERRLVVLAYAFGSSKSNIV